MSQYAADTVSLLNYLNSVVSDAEVSVVRGNDTFALIPTFVQDLSLESQKRLAEMMRLELNEVQFLPIQVYTSSSLIGSANQSYELCIAHNGKLFKGSTYLLPPPELDTLFWKRETATTEYGYSWARLSDPIASADAYRWEVRRIDKDENGADLDPIFRRARGGIF